MLFILYLLQSRRASRSMVGTIWLPIPFNYHWAAIANHIISFLPIKMQVHQYCLIEYSLWVLLESGIINNWHGSQIWKQQKECRHKELRRFDVKGGGSLIWYMYRFKKIPTDDWKEVCQDYWDFEKGGHRNHGKGKETAWKERNEYGLSTFYWIAVATRRMLRRTRAVKLNSSKFLGQGYELYY